MDLHTSKIDWTQIRAAAHHAKVVLVKFEEKGSRQRDKKFVVLLEGGSNRRPNRRGNYDGFAATWDQWGVFLGYLFDIDPDMVGDRYYKGQADFDRQTDGRFSPRNVVAGSGVYYVSFWPEDAHGDHNFKWDGMSAKCTKCKARQIR